MTVVAADGQYVHPVIVDEFRIATAETYDVIVEPAGYDAFTILRKRWIAPDLPRGPWPFVKESARPCQSSIPGRS